MSSAAPRKRSYSEVVRRKFRQFKRSRATTMVPRSIYTKPEFKWIDTILDQAITAAGNLTLINGCARGDDSSDRIGRQLIMKSIQISFTGFAANTTGIDQTHRLMLIYDKQPNGVFPGGADILDIISPWGMRNLNNRHRFIVLWDHRYSVSNDIAANQAGGNPRLHDADYYKRVNLKVTFNDSSVGTIADINTGSLYFCTFGSVAAGATAGGSIGTARIRFIDA